MSKQKIVSEINNALGAHGAWKLKLKTAVQLGHSTVSPTQIACDKSCAFGTWLHGTSIDTPTRSGMPYQVVRRLHAEFHECASRVASLANSGQKEAAALLLDGEYKQRSEKLSRALTKWKGELAQ